MWNKFVRANEWQIRENIHKVRKIATMNANLAENASLRVWSVRENEYI